jgi:hypothetical protein
MQAEPPSEVLHVFTQNEMMEVIQLRQDVSPKCWYTSTRQDIVIALETSMDIALIVKSYSDCWIGNNNPSNIIPYFQRDKNRYTFCYTF